ncbi:Longin-like domain-containing protein [Fimicolochytrium jonesii]|uniref:Longin-like domain-containing protein n=1 Tax=Fimicolochytrium jonesii TaxID=1396493 RepID=UPI0022FED072|nr:Longin-like domain-containing protein [Fimicolochytrium jonesii]KAI8817448.1 Longin-like domain-containing protein [Fimicolochytrium jonesii]
MVQVFCLAVAVKDGNNVRILAMEQDLSTFSFFQRGSIAEFVNFFTKTVVERTAPGQRAKVEENNFLGHVYVRSDGLSGIMVTDSTYPTRTAFSLLNRLVDEFASKFPDKNAWAGMNPTTTAGRYLELKDHLVKAKDPESSDPFIRVQKELDETKIVLHKTMESLLQRGEKLDDLVQKSEDLSMASKQFYKTAKKTNSCCGY